MVYTLEAEAATYPHGTLHDPCFWGAVAALRLEGYAEGASFGRATTLAADEALSKFVANGTPQQFRRNRRMRWGGVTQAQPAARS